MTVVATSLNLAVELDPDALELYCRLLGVCEEDEETGELTFAYEARHEVEQLVLVLGFDSSFQDAVAREMKVLVRKNLVKRQTVRTSSVVHPRWYRSITPWPRRVRITII